MVVALPAVFDLVLQIFFCHLPHFLRIPSSLAPLIFSRILISKRWTTRPQISIPILLKLTNSVTFTALWRISDFPAWSLEALTIITPLSEAIPLTVVAVPIRTSVVSPLVWFALHVGFGYLSERSLVSFGGLDVMVMLSCRTESFDVMLARREMLRRRVPNSSGGDPDPAVGAGSGSVSAG